MSNFSIYIPHIAHHFTNNFIVNQLSCYGKIYSIDILHNNSNYISAFVHFEITWPLHNLQLEGRNLQEDIIYRESNKLPILKHKIFQNNQYDTWCILRNKSIHHFQNY